MNNQAFPSFLPCGRRPFTPLTPDLLLFRPPPFFRHSAKDYSPGGRPPPPPLYQCDLARPAPVFLNIHRLLAGSLRPSWAWRRRLTTIGRLVVNDRYPVDERVRGAVDALVLEAVG